MSKDQVLGVVRHVLTSLGGVLVAKGVIDETSMLAIVGGLVAVAGFVWSVVAKRKA